MSLSVKNGGIGKSPAISRINRLSVEGASKAIAKDMQRNVQAKDMQRNVQAKDMQRNVQAKGTCAGNDEREISSYDASDMWDSTPSAAFVPCYPKTSIKFDSVLNLANYFPQGKTPSYLSADHKAGRG